MTNQTNKWIDYNDSMIEEINFKDPRVVKSIIKSLEIIHTKYMKEFKREFLGEGVAISKTEKNRIFPNNKNGRILSNYLLKVSGGYIPGTTVFRYQLHKPNLRKIEKRVNFDSGINMWLKRYEIDFENADGTFKFEKNFDGSIKGRNYNSLSMMPREIRKQVLKMKGFKWDYDISSATQAILYSTATKMKGFEKVKDKIEPLKYYIDNKSELRVKIANQFDLPEKIVKKILTGMINSPRLCNWSPNMFFPLFYWKYFETVEQIKDFNTDPFIISYVLAIRTVWKLIRRNIKENTFPSEFSFMLDDFVEFEHNKKFGEFVIENKERNLMIDEEYDFNLNKLRKGREKSYYFTKAEEYIMWVVCNEIQRMESVGGKIHDGMASIEKLDMKHFEKLVLETTGLEIKFSEEEL